LRRINFLKLHRDIERSLSNDYGLIVALKGKVFTEVKIERVDCQIQGGSLTSILPDHLEDVLD